MKKLWMALALWGALAAQLHAQWKPVEGRISTQWSEQVNPDKVLPEYPRCERVLPEMVGPAVQSK